MRDLYAILEIAPTASVEVIRAAYRTLAKRHHPDGSQPDAAKFRACKEAHDVLIDEAKRAIYDAQRGGHNGHTGHTGPTGAPPPNARPVTWVNGRGWVPIDEMPPGSVPYPPMQGQPTPYPVQWEDIAYEAGSQAAHDIAQRLFDQLFRQNWPPRGRR